MFANMSSYFHKEHPVLDQHCVVSLPCPTTCALVQEKMFVKLGTNIKSGNLSHEYLYFEQCDGVTWRQFKLDQPC